MLASGASPAVLTRCCRLGAVPGLLGRSPPDLLERRDAASEPARLERRDMAQTPAFAAQGPIPS